MIYFPLCLLGGGLVVQWSQGDSHLTSGLFQFNWINAAEVQEGRSQRGSRQESD